MCLYCDLARFESVLEYVSKKLQSVAFCQVIRIPSHLFCLFSVNRHFPNLHEYTENYSMDVRRAM